MKKVWSVISWILIAAIVVLAILLGGVRLFGLRPLTVLSGSMEPTYHTGSLIYVKSVDPYTLKEGDVVTFMLDEDTIATHRIIEVVPDEEDPTVIRFKTKGDANDSSDGGLVHYKNVIGTPVFSIPKLGYFVDFIQNPPGKYIAISAGAILLLLIFLPDIIGALMDDDKKSGENTSKDAAGDTEENGKNRTGEAEDEPDIDKETESSNREGGKP